MNIIPKLKIVLFESEEEENLNVKNQCKELEDLYRAYVEVINKYYERYPIKSLLSEKELRVIDNEYGLNKNPEITVVLYTEEGIHEHFEVEDTNCIGFFAVTDGYGIRKGTQDNFINENLECYINISENKIKETILMMSENGVQERYMPNMITTTLFHELKHIEDFLSLSGGLEPMSAELLNSDGHSNYDLQALILGSDAKLYLNDVLPLTEITELCEERVEESGREFNDKINMFVDQNIRSRFNNRVHELINNINKKRLMNKKVYNKKKVNKN